MKIQTKSSTVSLHFEKHKRSNMIGIGKHVERRNGQNHSNEMIDNTKSDNNIYLIDRRLDGSYTERLDKALKTHYSGKRGVRKDAVTMISTTVNLGGYIAEDCTLEEQVAVLTEAFNYLVKVKGKFDEANILSAVIHVDETTPHIHFDFVPFTDDGRLSAKESMTKTTLRNDQDGLLKHLKDKFPRMRFGRQEASKKLLKDGESLENRIIASELYQDYCEQFAEDMKDELEEVFENVRDLTDVLREEIDKNKDKERTLSDQLKAVDKRASELKEKEIKLEEKAIFEVLKLKQKKGELEAKEQELDSERSRLERIKDETEQERTMLTEFKVDLVAKEQELDSERSQLERIKDETEQERTMLTEIKVDLEAKEQELDSERSQLERIKDETEQEFEALSHFKETLKSYVQKIKDDINVLVHQGFEKLKKANEILNKKEYQPMEVHVEAIHKDLTALIENPLDFSDFEDLNTAEEMSL